MVIQAARPSLDTLSGEVWKIAIIGNGLGPAESHIAAAGGILEQGAALP